MSTTKNTLASFSVLALLTEIASRKSDKDSFISEIESLTNEAWDNAQETKAFDSGLVKKVSTVAIEYYTEFKSRKGASALSKGDFLTAVCMVLAEKQGVKSIDFAEFKNETVDPVFESLFDEDKGIFASVRRTGVKVKDNVDLGMVLDLSK